MIELFEKAALAGIGALALTQKKAEELLAELKERYGISEEEGRALIDRLKTEADAQQQRLSDVARDEVQRACDRFGLVRREEFDRLAARITALEKQNPSQDQ